ncbi:MAG: ADP-glyceromanno-heptose 6-epimerase [Alphaproteobacteria bacterium]|nr:ADP-glyceromanno-heptose 6-epimerase [Alphaproteobacteria bacterium SS10]
MYIVTGGAGFIGSNIVAGLEEAGLGPIVASDWFGTDNKWRNIAKRALFDIVVPEALPTFLANHAGEIKGVIHMGAISATTHKDVDEIVQNNVRLSLDLWEWCARARVPFIYASSAATYGDGNESFDDQRDAKGLTQLQPLNAYGWSKHIVDRRIQADLDAGRPHPPQWVGLKFFNVYGPNEFHKGDMMSVPCKRYPELKAGEPFRLFASDRPDYEDGGQRRDFVYVKDCIDVILWALKNEQVSGLFNCGTGRAESFKDLAEATYAAMGMTPNIEYIPMPDQLKGKYQYFTQAEMGKLRDAGYNGQFRTVEQGMQDYVANYLSQADQYR